MMLQQPGGQTRPWLGPVGFTAPSWTRQRQPRAMRNIEVLPPGAGQWAGQPSQWTGQPSQGVGQWAGQPSQPGRFPAVQAAALPYESMQQSWSRSYQQLPGAGNCYNVCGNRQVTLSAVTMLSEPRPPPGFLPEAGHCICWLVLYQFS